MKKVLSTFILLPLMVLPAIGCNSSSTKDLRPDIVKGYLSAKKTEDQLNYLEYYSGDNETKQNIDFIYKDDYDATVYRIYFATDKNFTRDVLEYSYFSAKFNKTTCLLPKKTYFYKMVDPEGSIVNSGSFTVKDTPGLPLSIEGVIPNFRDMGGWKTKSGKKVKYGMIYRGTRLNSYDNEPRFSEYGKYILDDYLGLKSELDLRWDSDNYGQTLCVWNENDTYVRIPLYQYTFFIPNSDKIENRVREYIKDSGKSLKTIFEFLANEDNYPIYAHCNGGADRTGTFAYLVNGLLGVSYADLTKDFELTSFCGSGRRWRSNIVYDPDTNTSSFDDTGVMQNDSGNYVAWDLMHKYMQLLYGDGKNSEQYAITNFLKTEIGITDEQINTIKSLLLE